MTVHSTDHRPGLALVLFVADTEEDVLVLGRVPGVESLAHLEIAVSMPLIICRGLGGHPGTATSTGTTLDTRPQLA